MGSNFNLGPIPEDEMAMDTTDLDTTLTDQQPTNAAQGPTTLLMGSQVQQQQQPQQGPGGVPVEEQLISSLPTDIPNLGADDNDLMLHDILETRQAQWI